MASSWRKILVPGFVQYTVLVPLDDGSIGLVYESLGVGEGGLGLNIRLVRFPLSLLESPE